MRLGFVDSAGSAARVAGISCAGGYFDRDHWNVGMRVLHSGSTNSLATPVMIPAAIR